MNQNQKPIRNQIYELAITDLTNLGYGVGRIGNMTVFVSGAVDGDVVSCRIIKVASSYAVGRVEKIVTPSPYRKTDCDHCQSRGCGGCAYRGITYEHELDLKARYVKGCFKKAGLDSVTVLPTVSTGKTDGYRNKAEYPVTGTAEQPVIGFYAPRSHRVTDARRCPLQPPLFGEILDEIASWITACRVPPYDEETGRGLLRHIYLRASKDEREVLVTLVINGDKLPGAENLIASLTARFPSVVGIGININREKTNVICGDEYKTLWGKGELSDVLCDVTLSFSAASFYQVNRDAAELLYRRAAELADFHGDELLLDLFCGVGSIGLSMADRVRRLIGVEIVPDAIRCAKENAKRNGIENASFYAGDASDVDRLLAPAEAEEGKPIYPDVVVLDPPRKGTDEKLLSFLASRNVPKIVYISCNPETLARDAKYLSTLGYDLSAVTPFDLFPRTGHVETVVLMSRDKE